MPNLSESQKELFQKLSEKIDDLKEQLNNNDLIIYFVKFNERHNEPRAKIALEYKKTLEKLGATEQDVLNDKLIEIANYYLPTSHQTELFNHWFETTREINILSQKFLESLQGSS